MTNIGSFPYIKGRLSIIKYFWLLVGFGTIMAGIDYMFAIYAGIIYVINDLMDIDLTYKATWVDYEEGTRATPGYFAYNTVTHGPIMGLNFKF